MNGKKTWIGLVITSIAILGEAATQIGTDPKLDDPTQLVKVVGALVLAIGSIHKLVKGE